MSHDAAPLFAGWEKGMILSCLQGHMGQVRTRGGHPPESALCAIGDFCFFAGRPDPALVRQADRPLLVPRTGDWAPVIRAVWGRRAVPFLRYALCGAPEDFDRDRLAAFAAALPPGFSLSPILAGHYPLLTAQDWSRDLCGNFRDGPDFARRGLGVIALRDGVPAAGAVLRRPADPDLPGPGAPPLLGRPRPALRRPGGEAGLPPGPPLPRLSSGPDRSVRKSQDFLTDLIRLSQERLQARCAPL